RVRSIGRSLRSVVLFRDPPLGGAIGEKTLQAFARGPPFGRRADQRSASSRSEVGDRRPHDFVAGFSIVGRRPANRRQTHHAPGLVPICCFIHVHCPSLPCRLMPLAFNNWGRGEGSGAVSRESRNYPFYPRRRHDRRTSATRHHV